MTQEEKAQTIVDFWIDYANKILSFWVEYNKYGLALNAMAKRILLKEKRKK